MKLLGEIDRCSALIVNSIKEFFQDNPTSTIQEVVLLSFDEERLVAFEEQSNFAFKKGITFLGNEFFNILPRKYKPQ